MQVAFPSQAKREQALSFARVELLAYVREKLFASAEDLGDATKDTPDELHERQVRVAPQCLHALQRLLALVATRHPSQARLLVGGSSPATSLRTPLLAKQGSEDSVTTAATLEAETSEASTAPGLQAGSSATPVLHTPEAADASAGAAALAPIREALDAFWEESGFWGRALGDDIDANLRAAGYQLLAALAAYTPDAVECRIDTLAPRVYAAVSDTDEAVQHTLWRMVLRFGATAPAGLRVVAVQAKLPKALLSVLKSGHLSTHGAASMLPLVAQMAQSCAEWRGAEFAAKLLAAMGVGVRAVRGHTRSALCAAIAEVLLFLVRKLEDAEAGSGEAVAAEAMQPFVFALETGLPKGTGQAVADAVVAALLAGAHKAP